MGLACGIAAARDGDCDLNASEIASSTPGTTEMGKSAAITFYVVFMAVVVVGVDLLFFRNRFWERLMVNVGIVLVFAAFYLRFLKDP
jgi:type IV secretory pathway VirB2 component (pilin)